VFLIVLILMCITLIVPNVHIVIYICVQGYLLVPLSLGVLVSQCMLYVYCLTYYLHMRTLIINSINGIYSGGICTFQYTIADTFTIYIIAGDYQI